MWQRNQMQAIRDAGALSRYIARTNEEITRLHQQAYENQQQSYDRVNRQFSNYIRGVQQYTNPYAGTGVTLPSGYRDTWVSETGEYVLSNDAGFNPNTGSTVNWQRMKPAQ